MSVREVFDLATSLWAARLLELLRWAFPFGSLEEDEEEEDEDDEDDEGGGASPSRAGSRGRGRTRGLNGLGAGSSNSVDEPLWREFLSEYVSLWSDARWKMVQSSGDEYGAPAMGEVRPGRRGGGAGGGAGERPERGDCAESGIACSGGGGAERRGARDREGYKPGRRGVSTALAACRVTRRAA